MILLSEYITEGLLSKKAGIYNKRHFPEEPDETALIEYLDSNGFTRIDDYISIRPKLIAGLKKGERYYEVYKVGSIRFIKFWASRWNKYTMEFEVGLDNGRKDQFSIRFYDDPIDNTAHYNDFNEFRKDAIEIIDAK